MKAVILAAGEGVRMRPLTYTRPKVMLPIANKPILEHLLLEVREVGIRDFIFIIGYHGETVRSYFGNGRKWGVRIEYILQMKQLGTADALGMAQGFIDGKFLLLNGDVLVKGEDIARFISKEPVRIGVVEVEHPENLGVVEVVDGKVRRILEKVPEPPSNLVNAGVYLLEQSIFDAISRTEKSPRGEFEITDSLQFLINGGVDVCCERLSGWLDVSYPWDILSANETFLKELEPQNQGEVEEGAVIKETVVIGKGTVIRSNSYIIGPTIIGEDCEIGPNCYIRASSSIGDGCHIGNAVEVKNCIIMKGTNLPHHNYVGDSVIGEGCNFGAGTKVANLRLDDKDIIIGGVNTGRKKLGAIIGDRVHTGINASINVGSTIGNDTRIGPGALAHGVILPRSRVF